MSAAGGAAGSVSELGMLVPDLEEATRVFGLFGYREVERAAVLGSNVRAFCLSSGNLKSPEMAGHFLARLDEITAACAEPGPLLYAVTRSEIRRLEL